MTQGHRSPTANPLSTLTDRARDNGRGEQHGPTRALVFHPFKKDGGRAAAPLGLLPAAARPADHRLPEARLAEAISLAAAIDLDVVASALVPLSETRPATYIGVGKIAEFAEQIAAHDITLVVADCELSPGQQRNLEKALGAKVIDRTGLILEIFGARAHTKEGRLQVELAHLTYQKSRLVRTWTHLERQRGGFGFMGGPGETQIEADRRMIGDRIAKLRRALEGVVKTRGLHRRARQRVPYPVVAVVGYTNAGKSTLFNRLTRAEVLAADMLFATLDPTMRALVLPSGRRVILSDTVGFVSNLPTHLVAAFRATLEEVVAADLILHVRDVAHPESEAQKADVVSVLKGLDVAAEDEHVLEVLNKVDLLAEPEAQEVRGRAQAGGRGVVVSALSGEGMDALAHRMDAFFAAHDSQRTVVLPHADGAALAWLYAHGDVVERREQADDIRLTVRMDPVAWHRFERAHPVAAYERALAAQ